MKVSVEHEKELQRLERLKLQLQCDKIREDTILLTLKRQKLIHDSAPSYNCATELKQYEPSYVNVVVTVVAVILTAVNLVLIVTR